MEELPDLHIPRPYATLDEYLEGDFWTVDRKEMFLIGAPSFDVGVAVKFTIELEDGTAVVTGEGRVVEYTAPSDEFPGGLKVRFRQLDSDAKAVLRRALELRRKAYQAAMEEAAAAEGNATAQSAEANAATPAEAPPAAAAPAVNAVPAAHVAPAIGGAPAIAPMAAVLPNPPAVFAAASGAPSIGPDLLAMSVTPARPPSALVASPKPRAVSRHHAKVVSPPPNRDALLRRLRERARTLPAGAFRTSQNR
jgi:hypothetical protein